MTVPPGFTFELIAVDSLSRHPDVGGHGDNRPLTREYLVRRAAALDRLAEAELPPGQAPCAAEYLVDANEYAQVLLDYGRAYGTTRGPAPAGNLCWDEDPRHYTRQEHAMWVLEHDVP
ncbi:hypothetical protein ACH4OW_26190 [Streptomyces sp. NPDC017056]|uniref:hypothetical protein n=1 Tax=Streptomyces sp. NPDC017056 TaxID=3364973 RepID=UPI0037B7DECC